MKTVLVLLFSLASTPALFAVANSSEKCFDPTLDAITAECLPTPIVIDVENDGLSLTGLDDPVWFDVDADASPDLISWTDRSDGFLVWDRDGNGLIDDGSEMFGNATRLADGSRASNGYIALAELDSAAFGGNADGVIDSFDSGFTWLNIWKDENHDGISQLGELQTLLEAEIQRIDLDYRRSNRRDRYGNQFKWFARAWKTGHNGALLPIVTADVSFLVAP